LSSQFPFDFLRTDYSGRKSRYEAAERIGKMTVFGCERRDVFDRSDGSSSDEHQVTANSESRILLRKIDSLVEGSSTRHQSGAGENSLAMCSDNSFVYSTGETEVICVED
jgi:hypothetical protein